MFIAQNEKCRYRLALQRHFSLSINKLYKVFFLVYALVNLLKAL